MDNIWWVVLWAAMGVLAYTLCLYPLITITAGLGRRPKELETSDELPQVTIIIPAYNEEACIRSKVANACHVDYPRDRLHVVVVSDGSTDQTVEIARQFAECDVEVVACEENRGKASVITEAVANCASSIVCLTDANVLFHRDALRWLIAPLTDPQVGAVSGDVRLVGGDERLTPGESLYYRMERAIQLGESRMDSIMGVDGGMYVVRRELFPEIPADTILDDFVVTMSVIRAGYRVVYEPRAIARELGTASLREEFRRRVRVAAGVIQSILRGQWPPARRPLALWQYVSHKMLRWCMPPILLVITVAGINLAAESRVIAWGLTVVAVAMAGILTGAFIPAVATRRFVAIPLYFLVSQLGMVVGFLKGLLMRQPGHWRPTARSSLSIARDVSNRYRRTAEQ